jgi:uncharacterized membrane protein
MERSLLGLLVIVVLLLVVMPALLYLIGWAVPRYTRKAPAWLVFAAPQTSSTKPRSDAPATGEP